MQFKKVSSIKSTWPCVFNVPNSSGGVDEQTAHFVFEIHPDSEFSKFKHLSDRDFLRKVVVGFGDDITDENGNKLEFSLEQLNHILEWDFYVLGLVGGYQKFKMGVAEKNVARPPASGQVAQ